jgi:hypothetical protein
MCDLTNHGENGKGGAMSRIGRFVQWGDCEVMVHDHVVPYLSATELDDGGIILRLDHRVSLQLTKQEAKRFVPFLADYIAVTRGQTPLSFKRSKKEKHLAEVA